jgi:hypothetical protein
MHKFFYIASIIVLPYKVKNYVLIKIINKISKYIQDEINDFLSIFNDIKC